MNTARTLQAGQTYDPGYDVPDLAIGRVISGHTVIAATRQIDAPGYLPGLHTVTAYDPTNPMTPYVTWEVAGQPYQGRDGGAQDGPESGREPGGRWVANSGHYFTASQAHDALLDMLRRAGRAPGEDA
jgi:hypothetical protein